MRFDLSPEPRELPLVTRSYFEHEQTAALCCCTDCRTAFPTPIRIQHLPLDGVIEGKKECKIYTGIYVLQLLLVRTTDTLLASSS